MASLRSARGSISVSCLFVAAVSCATSMVVCHWLFNGPSRALVAHERSERDRLGDELNRVQAILTQTQGQLWQLQSMPAPQCPDPQVVRVRNERRPTPVFWPEWTP